MLVRALRMWILIAIAGTSVLPVASQGIAVEFSMVKTSAMVGEPLLLKYTITNESTRNVIVDLSKGQTGWFNPGLTCLDGQVLRKRFDRKPVEYGGVKVVPTGALSPGQSISDEWVVQRHFIIERPGTYSLSPVSGLVAKDDRHRIVGVTNTGGPFTITITAPTADALKETASLLLSQVSSCRLSSSQTAARIDAMLTMPPETVSGVWMRLATDPNWVNQWTAAAFLQMSDTPQAADALALMWDNAPANSDTKSVARAALVHLLSAPSPDLVKYVRRILVNRDGKAPSPAEGNAAITD